MTVVEKRDPGQMVIRTDLLPERLKSIINVEAWAYAVIAKQPYREPNPDYISQMLALKTISAASIEEVFTQSGIKHLQDIVPDAAGATTGPIEITDVYVAKSDFEAGIPCYVIMTWTDLDLGGEVRVGTGAINVQATLIGLLTNGMWPIRCQIMRGDQKDKGDRHLFFMIPPDQEYIG